MAIPKRQIRANNVGSIVLVVTKYLYAVPYIYRYLDKHNEAYPIKNNERTKDGWLALLK